MNTRFKGWKVDEDRRECRCACIGAKAERQVGAALDTRVRGENWNGGAQ